METPNEKASGLGKDNVQDIHNLPNPGEKVNHFDELLVGWDSEYDITNGFTPISTQFYVMNDGQSYFWEHIGRKLSFVEIINFLTSKYPGYSHIKLITHFGRSEIMGLVDGRALVLDNQFLAINKTLIGTIRYDNLTVEVVDTYLLTMKSLEEIGSWIGMQKLKTNGYRESGEMLKWYQTDPEEFKKYALRDPEITVKFYVQYMNKLHELGLKKKKEPKTVGSISERNIFSLLLKKENEKSLAGLGYQKELNKDSKGKVKGFKLSIPRQLKRFEDAYYGGKNEDYLYGIHKGQVFDYDLKNAYASVLSLLPECDFNNTNVFTDAKELFEYLIKNPLSLGFVHFTEFEFKDYVRHPSLPIKFESGLYFPKSGETITILQEFLASYPLLKKCEIVAYVYDPIGDSIVSSVVNELRGKRLDAKKCGDTFSDETLKLIINSLYGKFVQGMNPNKKTLDLRNSTTQKAVTTQMPPSKITNPAIGSYITGFVRAIISEYLHYFDSQNIKVGNVTTDGFSVFGQLKDEELNGVGFFTKFVAKLLKSSLLEQKHEGEDFIGIKNRGYAFVKGENPLCAITGISLKKETDSQKRDFLLNESNNLTPFKNTKYPQYPLTSIRDWLIKGVDPIQKEEYRSYNFDYDLKRKPINAKTVDGKLHFETTPYESFEEMVLYRESYRDFKRGTRINGRQVGTKNKLITKELVVEFETYVRLRKPQFNTVGRINANSPVRIFVNLLRRFNPKIGYKKISKLLNIPISTIRYWIKDNPMSESELKRGANSDILKIYKGSLFAPSPELLNLLDFVISEFEKWIEPQPSIINEFPGIETPISDIPSPIMGISTNDNANKDSS